MSGLTSGCWMSELAYERDYQSFRSALGLTVAPLTADYSPPLPLSD
jgi:hypothetical protein